MFQSFIYAISKVFIKEEKKEKEYSIHVLREQTIFGIRISKFIRPTKTHRNISKKDPISFENNIIFQYWLDESDYWISILTILNYKNKGVINFELQRDEREEKSEYKYKPIFSTVNFK